MFDEFHDSFQDLAALAALTLFGTTMLLWSSAIAELLTA